MFAAAPVRPIDEHQHPLGQMPVSFMTGGKVGRELFVTACARGVGCLESLAQS